MYANLFPVLKIKESATMFFVKKPSLVGCDIYWGFVRVHMIAHADADKDKLNGLDRLEVNKSEDNL